MSDDLLNRVANQIHSIAIHMLRRARTADRETGLTPERLSLLSILAYAGPKSISELAAIEMVSLPAITRIVNYLESLSLVSRDRDSDDGRVVHVSATKKGLKLMEAGRRKRVENVANELASLRGLELMVVAEATEVLSRIDRQLLPLAAVEQDQPSWRASASGSVTGS
jgi:DNA-binding MarR family transcriptional regulator